MPDPAARDLIVAPITPPGVGAVAILRLSGAGACSIVEGLLPASQRPRWQMLPPRTLGLFQLVDPGDLQSPLDEALLVHFPPAASFTGEEVVEIQGHGAPAVVEAVLQAVLRTGARLAEPGEFTFRAFRNGRLDLTEAEGLLLLATATTAASREGGLQLLQGGLRSAVERLRQNLTDLLARIEVVFDYPEDVPAGEASVHIGPDIANLRAQINALCRSWQKQQVRESGLKAVLLGAPNAGKSSLFNALLGTGRALVHETPGTTRDVVDAPLLLDGYRLVLHDTAGQRPEAGAIEEAGQEQALSLLPDAGLLIHVLDVSVPPSASDTAIARLAPACPRLTILNKADLGAHPAVTPWLTERAITDALAVSATAGTGLDAFRDRLRDAAKVVAGDARQTEAVWLTQRQFSALQQAASCLDEAQIALTSGMPEDFIAHHLREALGHLLGITGALVDETMLQAIFSQFCVGK